MAAAVETSPTLQDLKTIVCETLAADAEGRFTGFNKEAQETMLALKDYIEKGTYSPDMLVKLVCLSLTAYLDAATAIKISACLFNDLENQVNQCKDSQEQQERDQRMEPNRIEFIKKNTAFKTVMLEVFFQLKKEVTSNITVSNIEENLREYVSSLIETGTEDDEEYKEMFPMSHASMHEASEQVVSLVELYISVSFQSEEADQAAIELFAIAGV
jgi:hypothetical protein